jgi:fumarate reductase flavoprotein subunit
MNKYFSRRDFLKGATTGALGVAAVSLVGCSPAISAATASPTASPSSAPSSAVTTPQVSETISTDILIVGTGAAGIFAAYEAGKAKTGKVLVISNSPSSDATNGNMVSGTCAVDSSYTKAIGQKFTSKQLYDNMYAFSHHAINGRLLRTCVDYMPENIDIFTEMGIKFTLGGDRYGGGFLNVHLFATDKKNPLMQAYEEKNFGVEFRFNTQAYQPILNGKTVTGVFATDKDGKTIQINAKAVILACGGFIDNADEMTEKFGVNVVRLATEWQTGKGISIAEQAGAFREGQNGLGLSDIVGANEKVGFSFANPLTMAAFFGNLLVDPAGDRFTNEFSLANASMSYGGEALLHVKKYYAIYSQAVIDDLKTKSYYEHIGSPKMWPTGQLVYSKPIPDMQKFVDEAIQNGWCWKADSIQGLATAQNLTNLAGTVKAYDAMISAGVDNEFGKPIEMCEKIENGGPYYLVQYNPGAFNTFGGCRTDEFTQALTKDFEVIPGLYIAGVENGSLYARPYYDVGGTCSGLAYSSGRLAGKQAATYTKSL